jgi:O-antigen/teichoic acid export membrane protein
MPATETPPSAPSRRDLLVRGIGWTFVHQVLQAVLAFGSMLVLVRILTPVDYGQAAAVVGLLTLLNAIGCGPFIDHALQLPDGRQPSWSQHFSWGMYIQAGLAALCTAIAGVLWLLPTYAPLAPLLHLASIGLLIDCPNRMRVAMLRRDLDLRRLRLIQTLSLAFCSLLSIAVALAGGGAYALVLSANVAAAMPFAFDLLVVQRWRPEPGWWRAPRRAEYRTTLEFGVRHAGASLLHSARGGIEAIVLPAAIGFGAVGLIGRAQALFTMTIWRVAGPLIETVYPLLPRYASNDVAFRRNATLFAQVILLLVIPGAIFLGVHGPALSRVLYGERWAAADPLLWPAAWIGIGLGLFTIGANIVLARTAMRRSLTLYAVSACAASLATLAALLHRDLVVYAWSLAGAQMLAGVVAVAAIAHDLAADWLESVLLPPAAAAAAAAAVSWTVAAWSAGGPAAELAAAVAAYGIVLIITLRALFPRAIRRLLGPFRSGERIAGWLRLSPHA